MRGEQGQNDRALQAVYGNIVSRIMASGAQTRMPAPRRDGRLRGIRVGLGDEVYSIDDFPATARLIEAGGGAFIIDRHDREADPAERELLAELGFAGVLAAASADVPTHVRNNLPARLAFFSDTVKDLLAQGNFKGRQAVLALPAASMFIQHLRMPKLDEEELKKALPWEARGKLPIDPSHALLRHIVAGEVYQDSEQKLEVILLARSAQELQALALARDALARGFSDYDLLNATFVLAWRAGDEAGLRAEIDC